MLVWPLLKRTLKNGGLWQNTIKAALFNVPMESTKSVGSYNVSKARFQFYCKAMIGPDKYSFLLFLFSYHLLKQSLLDCTAAHAANNRLTVKNKHYGLLVYTRMSISLERYVGW